MQLSSLAHTVFYFLVALAILVAFHEYGHFFAARKLGVKVIRFSIGLGKSVWRYRKSAEDTEYSIGVLPLGGYVKMVDEREGPVADEDLPRAFNRQRVSVRAAIVFAGPFANFLLAILLFWLVFLIGEQGVRPVLGPVAAGTLAAEAGFQEGDEIVAVNGVVTPTWGQAITEVLVHAMVAEELKLEVRTDRGRELLRQFSIPPEIIEHPESLRDRLGLQPSQESVPAVLGWVDPQGAAWAGGLLEGDKVLGVDGVAVKDWQQWVEYIRAHPEQDMRVEVERQGKPTLLTIRPVAVESAKGKEGRIGASVWLPQQRLGVVPAFTAAVAKTTEYSLLTLKMIGHMAVGKASAKNLSGPIGIAQSAGQSASRGLVDFLGFLSVVSISLAVLNLLPIPVLDGGHLLFYLFEAVRGKPIPELVQVRLQNIGIALLLTLMVFSFYVDIMRSLGLLT